MRRTHALDRPRKKALHTCPNETPVNFGDWCVGGPQPIFSSTSNEHAPTIPFVQWLQAPDRDADLAWWSPGARGQGDASGNRSAGGIRWEDKKPKAVFIS